MPDTVAITLGVLVINIAAFLAFWADKQLAISGSRRISENTLHWLALVGGSPGAVTAQRTFRHKTQKGPFRSQLRAIVMLQVATIAIVLALWLGPEEWSAGLLDRLRIYN